MVLLVVIFPAGRLVSAGCTMVLLVVIFPAGRLVSAGGSSFHPAGSATPMSGSAVPDTAGGSSFHPAGSATPMSGSAVPDTAGGPLDTTDSDDSSSPSPVSTDHIPIDVLFEPTPGGINAFFLDSDEDEQIAEKESGSPLQTALVCNSNPLMVARLPKSGWYSFSIFPLG
ncbi:hypothetical protein Tco_0569688 [Tanacetum coccineum]